MAKKFVFSKDTWEYNNTRLTNQIFKLLPMYEKEEDWQKQLDSILLELKGYNDQLETSANFMILIGRLGGLPYTENKIGFRKLVFESIAALKEIVI